MSRRILAAVVVTAIWGMTLSGCSKKEQAEKAEAPTAPPAAQTGPATAGSPESGEALFKKHCAVCHPDGGNIMKPEITLRGRDLAARKITKPADIVKIMRNPGPGMNRFDEATLPDRDAAAIAEYVLEAFK